jgi:hypothetical protein
MKPIIPFALLGALLAVGTAQAASTTPVGYTTTPLTVGQFSFVGLTVQHPTLSAGVLTAESANSVTAGTTDFVALLGAPGSATYILELPDGTIQEVTTWTNTGVLTTPDDVTAAVTPNTTTYKLRKAATISDIFGATNSAGLKPDTDGDFLNNADLVTVLGAGGAQTTIYYYNDGSDQGWYTAGGADAANIPVVYADGFYVKRQAGGGPLNLVVTGEVKTVATKGVLINGYNFISSVAPAGLTLGTSGLQNFISPDTEGDYTGPTVDNVLLPQPNGSFVTAYYYNDGSPDAGWFTATGGDAANLPLEGTFLILNKGASKPYTLSVPNSYNSL